MLTRLDQLPHKRLQLVVPLDQIAQVGVQGLLEQTHTKERVRKQKKRNGRDINAEKQTSRAEP